LCRSCTTARSGGVFAPRSQRLSPVNAHFANELNNLLQPDDVIWVHDYHLIPLAKMLRDLVTATASDTFCTCIPAAGNSHRAAEHEWLIPQLSAYDARRPFKPRTTPHFARYLENECRMQKRGEFSFKRRNERARRRLSHGIETNEFSRLHGVRALAAGARRARQLGRAAP